jgi:hypothetical protein
MTNSKWLSALLAGTALTVASTAAFADTSFLTMTRNAAGEGVTFKVSPTADMPAATTEVTVAGEVRALLRSSKTINVAAGATGLAFSEGDRDNDIATRARIFVRGKTETAVGAVGAKFRVEASDGGSASINQYTGYWEFAPGITLTAGKTDSISSVVYGADWNGTGGVWNGVGAGLTNAAVEQVNISFATGPVTFAIGLEDNTSANQFAASDTGTGADFEVNPGIAASMNFSSGDFGAQVAGRTQSFDSTPALEGDSGYMIGGGLGYSSGAFGLQVGAATGRGLANDYIAGTSDILGAVTDSAAATNLDLTDDKFSAASVLGTFSLTETTSIEAWYGMGEISDIGTSALSYKVSGYGGGLFWNPVSQLRLGVGGDIATVKHNGTSTDGSRFGVGAWFKF